MRIVSKQSGVNPIWCQVAAAIGCLVVAGKSYASEVYWLDAGAAVIQSSDLAGNNVQTIVTRLPVLSGGLAVDPVDGWIYWSVGSTSGTSGVLERARLDGSRQESILTDTAGPHGIAVDPALGKIFWVDSNGSQGAVKEANLDGSAVRTIVTGLVQPFGLTIDASRGKLYWTDVSAEKIQRSNLDGSGVQTLVSTGLLNPRGITINPAAQTIYWTDDLAFYIGEANADGTQRTSVLSYRTPDGIAYSPENGRIYWADFASPGKIMSSSADGSNVGPVVTGLMNPREVVVVPEPIAGALYLGVAAALICRLRRCTITRTT